KHSANPGNQPERPESHSESDTEKSGRHENPQPCGQSEAGRLAPKKIPYELLHASIFSVNPPDV
ncbi:MAG: hypothetical protein ACXWR4_22060, partial [Bdellovibrionota bacterium]